MPVVFGVLYLCPLEIRALGHHITHGDTQCALAPSQKYMFHFCPSCGGLRGPFVMLGQQQMSTGR